MELWIRSQDKTLLTKVNSLWLWDNTIWFEVPFYENHKVVGLSITGHNHKIATYKTKERALEVLDEIQKILKPMIYTEKGKIVGMINNEFIKEKGKAEVIELSTYVYEMPEE